MTQISDSITGVYETHLPVRNLTRALDFYVGKLGLELARKTPSRNAAFLWVGDRKTGMLGLWETGSAPLSMTLHMAFRCEAEALEQLCGRLQDLDVPPLGFAGNPITEPDVIGWMPAMTVYCKDPDGHSIEFLSVMNDAPDPDFGAAPLRAWRAAKG
jgi:lactoylglutathione lyase